MASAAVFLDLEGTLGGEGLGDIRSFSFYHFAPQAIREINEAGLLAIVVTNQSRISRGLITQELYERHLAELKEQLAEAGARFDAVYCCPHTREDGCQCRKPLPGMVLQAQ